MCKLNGGPRISRSCYYLRLIRSFFNTSSHSPHSELTAFSVSSTLNVHSPLNRAYESISRVQFSVRIACVVGFGCWLVKSVLVREHIQDLTMQGARKERRKWMNWWKKEACTFKQCVSICVLKSEYTHTRGSPERFERHRWCCHEWMMLSATWTANVGDIVWARASTLTALIVNKYYYIH